MGWMARARIACTMSEPSVPKRCGRAIALCLLFGSVTGLCVAASSPKRVLIIHSFGSAAPPFTTHSTAFETELTEKMGERVDLDEISLDVARYATLEMEEAIVELMRKRQAKWQPDLVVPIGSPAGVFVAQYRDRLFPKATPILYAGMDKRRLPAGALEQNATFVGESFDIPGMVEDMLQVAPATTNIVVIIGASPLEQYWAKAIGQEWAPFTNRVSFTWLNDLSFDRILERVSNTPPRSFIFFILLMRDASGVTHNGDEVLKRIHAVANAPVNSFFREQLGLGIVGGRMYQAEHQGVEAARIAIRVLHGEPITNFPPKIVGPLSPRYDWRELRRWKISEQRLPPGSTVLFREPTTWQRYRWWIIGAIYITLLQASLIVLLVLNLRKRRHVEKLLRESETQFRTVADSAPVLIWMSGVDKLCTFFNKPWLDFTGRTAEQEMGNGWSEGVHPDDRRSCLKTYTDSFDARQPFVIQYRLRRHDGEYRWISDQGVPRYDEQGIFAGYIGSCTDITERLQNENEIQQLRLETWHAARVAQAGMVSASLAHELNQPLAAILSNAQAGLRFMDSKNPGTEEIRPILEDIVHDDKRAGAIISGLRAMLRRQESRRERIDLAEMTQDMLDLLHSELLAQQVRVRTGGQTGCAVVADKAQIQQVLMNLVMNAIEAMQSLPANERRLEVLITRPTADTAQVSVRDTGPGLPAEQAGELFEAFRTTKAQGLGIGLSICRSIVESHGGRIWLANNQPGETVFCFTLPLDNHP